MAKILIIDDDQQLTTLFQDYLEAESFEVDIIHNGRDGLIAALSTRYDLIILDMMLPDTTGTEILKTLRQKSMLPVLMFTAKGDDIDRIIGLESGADDYVPKPCTPRELVAHIRAILRRATSSTSNQNDSAIVTGLLALYSEKREATWSGESLDLTSTEFNLLEILARNVGKIVSKQALSEYALGRPLERYDRSIDVHISSIRQKIGQQNDSHAYIQTIRGHGYQLIKA